MPFYDYECSHCGHSFEEFQSMSDAHLITCPKCKSDSLKRLIAPGSGLIFKGSGFYINDSRAQSGQGQSKEQSNSSQGAKNAQANTSSKPSSNNTASKSPEKPKSQE